MLDQLRSLPPITFARAIPIALLAAVLIGIPSDLIDNRFFGRPIEPKAIDYVILAVTAAIAGLIFAIRPEPASDTVRSGTAVRSGTVLSETTVRSGTVLREPAAFSQTAALSQTAVRSETQVSETSEDTTPIWGGFLSFLAVGCPVCNQVVVGLVGTSGALSWWAPVQPVVGLAAIGVMIWALKKRLATYQLTSCPIPEQTATAEKV